VLRCACGQVRLGEKEALDGLMGFFEGRGADLKALEYYQVCARVVLCVALCAAARGRAQRLRQSKSATAV
jgi:hypothetical protein